MLEIKEIKKDVYENSLNTWHDISIDNTKNEFAYSTTNFTIIYGIDTTEGNGFVVEITKDKHYLETSCTTLFRCATLKQAKKKAKNILLKMKSICLFEHYNLQPKKLSNIVDSWSNKMEQGLNYEDCKKFLKEVEKIGFTFDYYLDAEPFNLTKIG